MDLDNKVGETVKNASVEADGKDVTNTYVTESAQYTEEQDASKEKMANMALGFGIASLFIVLFAIPSLIYGYEYKKQSAITENGLKKAKAGIIISYVAIGIVLLTQLAKLLV